MSPPRISPLTWNVQIVDKLGNPTPEFMRKFAGQLSANSAIPTTAAELSKLLDLLTGISGDLLIRGPVVWQGLHSPNDATKYLDGTGHYTTPPDTDPILGTAVPSVLEPAGWLYSRSGAKELYQSNPTSTPPLAIVQHKSAINGNSIPGAVTLAAPPTPGNLIVMFLHTNTLASLVTKNTTGWTEFESVVSSTSQVGSGVYRYAQLGDTATLPALWTAGSTYWAYDVYEISGVSGVFATDAVGHNKTTTATPTTNVTSLASAAVVTTLPNALALLGAGQYNGNADPTLSVGWARDEFGHNNTNYGSDVGGSQAIAASGASVSATVTFTTNSAPADLILLVLQAPTVQMAHWDLIVPPSGSFTTFVAAANLNGNFAVKVNGAGLADVPALASLTDGQAIIGITTGAIATGASGPVQTEGNMSDSAWAWTPGLPVYAANLGALTQTAPAGKWVLQVGVAETATSLAINIGLVISTPL